MLFAMLFHQGGLLPLYFIAQTLRRSCFDNKSGDSFKMHCSSYIIPNLEFSLGGFFLLFMLSSISCAFVHSSSKPLKAWAMRTIPKSCLKSRAHQLLLGELLWANKSSPRHLSMKSVTLSVSHCFSPMSSGTLNLLWVLQNYFRNFCYIYANWGLNFLAN